MFFKTRLTFAHVRRAKAAPVGNACVGVVGLHVQTPVRLENASVGGDSFTEQTTNAVVVEELLDEHLKEGNDTSSVKRHIQRCILTQNIGARCLQIFAVVFRCIRRGPPSIKGWIGL